ncbi:hypothetical protein LQZ18_18200 [Lachnospiraceae bacterium ZAX-1]
MEYQTNASYEDKHSHGFSIAALVLGIIGVATCCCIYATFICGALAIIFALLSRGGEMNMGKQAKAGMALGIIGIALAIILIIFAAVMLTYLAGTGGLEDYFKSYFDLYDFNFENLYSAPYNYL